MNTSLRPATTLRSGLRQSGVTTLVVTLLLLAIVTIIVLFSTNVAFFEQRTTTYENRARTGEQAAEFAMNVTGEWMKSQVPVIVDDATNAGWLDSGASSTSKRWAKCSDAAVEIAKPYLHPCEAMVGANTGLLNSATTYTNLYFYARGGVATGNADRSSASFNTIYDIYTDTAFQANATISALLTQVNGTFTVTPKVQAVLCRIDSTDPTSPVCALEPERGNNIAVTLISESVMGGESTDAVVMETWSTYTEFFPSSSVPLVASGTINGLGNAQIVAAPNAGGFGLAASIWSSCQVAISGGEARPTPGDWCEATVSGVGSVSTCHLEGYLEGDGVALEDMLKPSADGGCAGNNQCKCPGLGDRSFMSGHEGGFKEETYDILDRDGNAGSPDITFFPGKGLDDPNDPTDDNLFEWIFGLDYVSKSSGGDLENDGAGGTSTDCGDASDENCAVWALINELGAQLVTCTQLTALGANAEGLYYVTNADGTYPMTGTCTLPSQLGSPDNSVIVVIDEDATNNNSLVYGMLFVRSSDGTAEFHGTGNAQVFGSVVVEGDVRLTGGIDLIYVDWAAKGGNPGSPPPARNFGRVSGSWLDASRGL